MSSAGGAVAASVAVTAAAAHAAKMRKEEEEMTKYNGDDLDGWEFKILRSHTGKFKKREFVDRVCREEALSGWEMLEKFDNNRIRFKRRTEHRARDAHAQIDPYRGYVGMGNGQLVLLILGIVFAVVGLVVAGLLVFQG